MTHKRIVFLVSFVLVAMQLVAAPESSTAEIQSAAPRDVRDIDMLSSTDGWMVGSQGKIWRYNGTDWVTQDSPTTENLNAVQALSANDAWAAGNNGVILRWNGSIWTQVPSSASVNLYHISFSNPSNGWIVGFDYLMFSEEVEAFLWDGVNLQKVDLSGIGDPAPIIYDVKALSPTEAWFLVDGSNIYDEVFLWNGQTFIEKPDLGIYASTLDFLNSNYGWVMDNRSAAFWDGVKWTTVDTPYSYSGPSVPHMINDIEIVSPTEVWAAGYNGSILKWDGTEWGVVNSPSPAHIGDLSVLTGGHPFFSGTQGWMSFDNGQWENHMAEEFYDDSIILSGVYSDPSGVTWAAGYDLSGSQIFRWNGSNWVKQFNPVPGHPIHNIDLLSENEAWLTEPRGLHQYTANGWIPHFLPDDKAKLHEVSMVDSTTGFAAGEAPVNSSMQPVIYHWDGTNWVLKTVDELPSYGDIFKKIVATSSDFAMVIPIRSYDGYWIWDGVNWTKNNSYTISDFDLTSDTDGWAWIDNSLYRWDGLSWQFFQSLNDLSASQDCSQSIFTGPIDMFSSQSGWTVLNCFADDTVFLYHWNGNTWNRVAKKSVAELKYISASKEGGVWLAIEHYGNPRTYSLDYVFVPTNTVYLPMLAR